MINLLFSSTAYPPSIGGAQIHLHKIATILQRDHNIKVISLWDKNRSDWLLGTTLNSHDQIKKYQIDGINVTRLGFNQHEKKEMLPWTLLYYFMMETSCEKISTIIENYIIKEGGLCDIVHNVRIGREPISMASLKSAKKLGVPFVFTPLHHPRWGSWLHRIYHQIYKEADAIIALTNNEKRMLAQLGVDPQRIFITGIGPILNQESNEIEFRQKFQIYNRFILFLGQHYQYKGFGKILEATKVVWKQHSDVHFVFAGPPVGKSEEIIKKFGDPRIHTLGLLSLQDKTNALASCSILCVPSMQESFGGVYTEAWSFKKPVIAGKIPTISEVVTDEVDGFLVQQNALEIADRINMLLEKPELASSMGEKGFDKVQNNYTWDVIAQKYQKIYHGLLG